MSKQGKGSTSPNNEREDSKFNPQRVCPYNKKHKVPLDEFEAHLLECRAKLRGEQPVPCFYNWEHKVKPSEMDAHLAECADRTRCLNTSMQIVHQWRDERMNEWT